MKNIQIFKTLDELFKEITNDKKSHSTYAHRFPVRFIFLSELWQLKKLVEFLATTGIKILELVDFLPNDDGWLTSDQIIELIAQQDKQKDFVIVPFSEIVRFYSKDDLIAVLNSLTEIENLGENSNFNRRFYIPFIGLYERFEQDFLRVFSRKGEWAPIWKLPTSQGKLNKIRICLTDFEVPSIRNIKLVRNTKEWLGIWKREKTEEIVCFSNTLSYLYKNALPDQVFDIEKIDNHKDFLLKLFGVNVSITYRDKEKKLWENLVNNILRKEDTKNFKELIAKYFNRSSIKKEEIINLWLEKEDTFSRWLLKGWVVSEALWKGDYIYLVMDSIKNFENEEFLNKLWFKVFDYDRVNENWSKERKNCLKQFYNKSYMSLDGIEDKLKDKLSSILPQKSKIEDKLKFLTDITVCERKCLIKIFKETLEENRSFPESLREVYPNLYYYLLSIEVDNLEEMRWIEEYFNEYKYSKLENSPSDKLREMLEKKNKDKDSFYKWYYSIESHYSIVEKEVIREIIWIDGLGMEWLSLFMKLVERYGEKYGIFVERKYVTRANLPSITECNRFKNTKHVRDLDNFIHSENPYKYPDDLIKQIELIDKIIRKNILDSSKSKILVVSDHGFTVFPQSQFSNIKKYNFKESNHEGRCMWTDGVFSNDEDFILHTPECECGKGKKSLITLKYSSLDKLPKREVHGGATPEEVLVPVIVVSRIKGKITYEIKPSYQEISIRNPKLYLSITPTPGTIPILAYQEKNKEIELRYDTQKGKWWAELSSLKAGTYNFYLKILDVKYKVSVEIKGGLKERDLL